MEWIRNKSTQQWISFLLVLLAFPVLTYGLQVSMTVTAVGLAMVIIGFLLPPIARYAAEG